MNAWIEPMPPIGHQRPLPLILDWTLPDNGYSPTQLAQGVDISCVALAAPIPTRCPAIRAGAQRW